MSDRFKLEVEKLNSETQMLEASYTELNLAVEELIAVLNDPDATIRQFGSAAQKFCYYAQEFSKIIQVIDVVVSKFQITMNGVPGEEGESFFSKEKFNLRVQEIQFCANDLSSGANTFCFEDVEKVFGEDSTQNRMEDYCFAVQGFNAMTKRFNNIVQQLNIIIQKSYIAITKSQYPPYRSED
jgi:hypothetical protein